MHRFARPTLAVAALTALVAGLVSPAANAIHPVDTTTASCSDVIGGATALLARDDIVQVARGAEANVEPSLNDRVSADHRTNAALVEPVTPPAGMSIIRGWNPDGPYPITFAVDKSYTGPEWVTLPYNLWDITQGDCVDGRGNRVLATSTASITVHVTGMTHRDALGLANTTLRVERGVPHILSLHGSLPNGTVLSVVGKAEKRKVRIRCANRRCVVRAHPSAPGTKRVFRIVAETPDGRADTGRLVVALEG